MIIPQYIRDLLLEGKNVAVAGLGTFECAKVQAGFDKDKNQFLPPGRKVTFHFDEHVKGTEFTFFVTEKEQIKIEDAHKLIEEAVEEINYQLDRGKRLRYNSLGLFYRDKDNKIVFEPDTELLKGGEFFGLNPVPVAASGKFNKVAYKRIFAIILLVAGVGLVGYWGYIMWQMVNDHNNGTTPTNAIVNPAPEKRVVTSPGQMALDSIRNQITPTKPAPDLNKTSAGTTEEDGNENDNVQTGTIKDNSVASASSGPKYYIVAGSFRSEEGAKKFVKDLKAKGYKSELFARTESGLNMVCYTSFASRSEADEALPKIRTEENNAAYIMKR
jgi:nucleoid DNA-binding protein